MTGADATTTTLQHKLSVVGEDDGAALLPLSVDSAAGQQPVRRGFAPPTPELTLTQLARLGAAAPFRIAA